ADRQIVETAPWALVADVAVALQPVGGERFVDIEPPQRAKPQITDQNRALTCRIEGVAIGLRPALVGINQIGLRTVAGRRGLRASLSRRDRPHGNCERYRWRSPHGKLADLHHLFSPLSMGLSARSHPEHAMSHQIKP